MGCGTPFAFSVPVTAPRPVTVGSTEALTRRTNFRKAVLAPWDPQVQQAWLYILATAAERYDVDVHHTNLVINHHHTLATFRNQSAAPFLSRLHQPMSCFLSTLLPKRGFDAVDQVWDNRQPHRMRLLDAPAMMAQLVYHQVQHMAAGLVDQPSQAPGWTFSWDLWRDGRFLRCERPDVYFDPRTRPKTVDLHFRPPAVLVQLFEGDVDKLIYQMKQLEREAVQALRRARRGRRARGRRALLNIHPYDEPRTRRETRGKTVPSFKVGAKGLTGRDLRIRACQEVTGFRQAARDCYKEWREGNRDVVFPFGTDKMVRVHGAQSEPEPSPEALFLAPGPLLEDALNEYGHRRHTELTDRATHALSEVRHVLADEAVQVLEESEAKYRDDTTTTPFRPPNDGKGDVPQGDVLTETLEGPSHTLDSGARRLVVRRTRPSTTGRRATAPPSGTQKD